MKGVMRLTFNFLTCYSAVHVGVGDRFGCILARSNAKPTIKYGNYGNMYIRDCIGKLHTKLHTVYEYLSIYLSFHTAEMCNCAILLMCVHLLSYCSS